VADARTVAAERFADDPAPEGGEGERGERGQGGGLDPRHGRCPVSAAVPPDGRSGDGRDEGAVEPAQPGAPPVVLADDLPAALVADRVAPDTVLDTEVGPVR